MTGFVIVGVLFAMLGLFAVVVGLRGDRSRPRAVAALIAGMMATAFGLLMAGFAIAYQAAAPLDLNDTGAAR